MRLSAGDLQAALDFLEEAHEVERTAMFTPELLDRLADLVHCETAFFFEVDQPNRVLSERVGSSKASADWESLTIPDDVWGCARSVQLNRYKNANGGGPVVLADVFSRRLRQRPDFNPNLRESDAVDEIHVDLDPRRQWKAEIGVYSSQDFGLRARMVMQVLRPHLAALYRSAIHRRRLATLDSEATAELTRRELEVMLRVADGLSNAEIASALVVERSTVRKHLEHVYEKLGVRSRTAALAKLRV